MIWEVSDNLDWRVGEYTGWVDVRNYKQIENRSGVFILVDCDLHVKYIGIADRGEMKDEIERILVKMKGGTFSRIKVLFTNSSAYAELLMPVLVKKYNPPLNLSTTKKSLIYGK
jgi:hypothetical protein